MKPAYDPFLRHEALHTAGMMASIVDQHLAQHPEIAAVPEWKAQAEEVVRLLGSLYQDVASADPQAAP